VWAARTEAVSAAQRPAIRVRALLRSDVRDGMRRPAPTGCGKLPHTHSRCKGDRP
jgi:hypothetical protein